MEPPKLPSFFKTKYPKKFNYNPRYKINFKKKKIT